MRLSIHIHVFILLLSAGLQLCLAQEGDNVTLQFLSFPRVAETQPVELFIGDGKSVMVTIPSNELSPTYQVPRLGAWTVGKAEAGEDGKPKFTVYGTATPLASSKQLLFLLRKGPNNADGFRIIPLDSSATHFGGRKFLLVNLTNTPVAAEIGGVKFALKPGMHHVVAPKDDQGPNLCHAQILQSKEDRWKPFMETNWPLSDKARGLILFYNDPTTGHIKLHSIQDYL